MIDPEWRRVEKLNEVVRAAGFEQSSVFLMDAPVGFDGMNPVTNLVPDAHVARRLADPEAEATALHELSHVDLGHNEDHGYEVALALDTAAGVDHHRAPWEVDADSLAAAYVESIADLVTDAQASLAALSEDVDRYT